MLSEFPMNLSGKVAVVTGAGTGIGAAVAKRLAASGARVVLVSRTTERIAEISAAIQSAGHLAQAVRGDVRSEDLRIELSKHVERVDILVNNAAVFASYGPLEGVPADELEDVMEVDLTAALRLTRFVLPGMKKAGWGRIINVGSVAGRLGAVGQVAYAAAKAGLEGFTRSLAAETARDGITCNLVEPGLVETPRTTEKIAAETIGHLIQATPLLRAGQPAEVAHAIAFLASAEASGLTGATLPVDGGLGLR
jgi:3-oxoacyl-[acyl-carrier protein] reductase